MKYGFYTALGTPLDENGNFIAGSFEKQIRQQITAGASGLLVMGSMGIEPYIKNSEYTKIAKTAVEAAKHACPVFIGVMDNSVSRVMEKINALKGMKIDGVFATVPYYYSVSQEEMKNYFTDIASKSPYPIYMYDLPAVTKAKIQANTAECLIKHDNIMGIKTGDLGTARIISRSPNKRNSFNIFFSGLDIFDFAYRSGIKMNLDGMFACTVGIAAKMYRTLENSDFQQAAAFLDEILLLRDTLAGAGIFPAFTYAMNLLGLEGNYSPDYSVRLSPDQKEKISQCMKDIKLL